MTLRKNVKIVFERLKLRKSIELLFKKKDFYENLSFFEGQLDILNLAFRKKCF